MSKKCFSTISFILLLTFFLLLLSGCGNTTHNSSNLDASHSSSEEASSDAESLDDKQASDNETSVMDKQSSDQSQSSDDEKAADSKKTADSKNAADAKAHTNSDNEASASALATPSSSGKLHVSGTQLTGENGEPVQLRGISTHGLAWFPDYVNEACFSQFRTDWNANVIRLAMYTAESGGYCTDGNQENLKSLIRSGVSYAASQDLYVIIDWHILSDSNPNTHLEEAKAFFAEMSAEFAQQNHILYEICNEPNGATSWSEIKSYAETIIPIIRTNDSDAVVIVGTPNWSQYVDQAAADPITGYDNLMYSLHFYAATHKDDLRSRMVSALSAGLPIFVTEYGICDASGNGALDLSSANQWVAEMNQHNISYVAWNLSNKNESSSILNSSCTKVSGFSWEDLSESGQWLYQMLTGNVDLPNAAASSANPDTDTASGTSAGTDSADDTSSSPDASSSQTFTNSSGELEISLSIVNSWETNGVPYYQYAMSLRNTAGSACSQWTVDLPFVNTLTFSDGWNGDYSVQGETLHITSKDYNGAIPAGETVSDIGFIIYGGKI